MNSGLAALLTLILGAPPGDVANPVYRDVVDPGRTLAGVAVRLPDPTIGDDMTADRERAALVEVAGSEGRLAEFLRDSVTAPTIVRISDRRDRPEVTIRVVDLWFAARADFEAIDLDASGLGASAREPVQAGNMRFEAAEVPAAELSRRKIDLARGADGRPVEAVVHVKGRLLDRIAVEATDQVYATRTARSILVASRPDPRFGLDDPFPDRWTTVDGKATGPPNAFAGGIGYVKASSLRGTPGMVLIEAHFAVAEPKAWFGGEPILRSKIGLAAQDRARALRRELAKAPARPRGRP